MAGLAWQAKLSFKPVARLPIVSTLNRFDKTEDCEDSHSDSAQAFHRPCFKGGVLSLQPTQHLCVLTYLHPTYPLLFVLGPSLALRRQKREAAGVCNAASFGLTGLVV